METHINTYKLNQGEKEYILSISTVGEKIRITCKNTLDENVQKFSRDFTLEELQKLDPIFNSINNGYDALDYIDRALKIQNVGVSEETDVIKIHFYIKNEGDTHNVELPIGGEMQFTSSNQTVNEYSNYNINQNISLEQNVINETSNNEDQYLNLGAYQENQNQYIEGIESTNNEYIQYSENNYISGNEDLPVQYTTEAQNYISQDNTTGATTSEYVTGDSTTQYASGFDSTNYTTPATDINQYVNTFQTTTQTVETTNQYYQPEQAFDSKPYITPVEEEQPIIAEYSQPTTFKNTNVFEQTTTTTNISDDRINKLMGDTDSLKNEHQLIQNKLNELSGEMSAYRNQLSLLSKQREANEVNALRAENQAIKQQLSELNSLRNDAAEVRVLRSQLAQLDPLRRKAAEMEVLKGQLSELNSLRAKVAELNAVKAQLGELNNLRAQVSQMNALKQQLAELNALKARMAELNSVKSQIGELNNLKAQVSQINTLKQQINELTSLKENAVDAENLKRKISELESIKLQYEKEIKNLRESQGQAQLLEFQKSYKSNAGMESKRLLFEDKPQQIYVKGDIIHNTEELELLTRKINKLNQKLTINLIYKATADSDKASVFHEKCDDAKSTLVLVETDKGKRFGGFTTCSWSGDCIDKKDEDAFVFSLDKMEIYENIPGEDAIGCYPKFGPIFLGCQIRIFDNAFTKGGTTFEKGLNFNTEEDFELTDGDRNFNVREIEVYEVISH